MRRFGPAGERLAMPGGQTLARWLVLEAARYEPVTVAHAARDLALARQSVQRVADLFAADGLAEYLDNPHDRRAKLLRLTPRGNAVLCGIQARQRTWADGLGARIGESDLRQASRILDRVLFALEPTSRRTTRTRAPADTRRSPGAMQPHGCADLWRC